MGGRPRIRKGESRVVPGRAGHLVASLGVLAAVGWGAEGPLKIADPAPPKVHRPTSQPAAAPASAHRRVQAFGRPSPLAAGAVTSDWPTFLGPTHNAVSPETKLLRDFTAPSAEASRPAVVWQMLKGEGYSSPVVAGERVVLFHRLRNEEVVDCLHAERATPVWQFRYPTVYRDRFNYNGGPRSTPAVADGRVFTYGAESKLHCLDLRTGGVLWKRDLAKEFDLRTSYFGAGSSPLVEGGLVILNLGVKNGPSVVAFDAATGRLVWGAETQWGAGYASPVPATVHGKPVVFVFAGGESDPPTGGLLCLDPRTGTTHFRFPFRSPRLASANASSPVVTGETVFISSYYYFGGAMLRVGPDLTHTVAFGTRRFGSHWMTPIVRRGHLYGYSNSTLSCLDLKTGEELWSATPPQQLPPDRDGRRREGGMGRASMLWADGAFLALGEYGDLRWMELSPKGVKVLAEAKLFHAPQTWTCPVLSRGLLYICQNAPDMRTRHPPRLLCYDLRGGP